ncbi:MAG TPA: DUF222 domain-containing protein, partial [Mycobacterium sp.]|nr:DUF222 domain-containing protein [Mycobacterium sp.]
VVAHAHTVEAARPPHSTANGSGPHDSAPTGPDEDPAPAPTAESEVEDPAPAAESDADAGPLAPPVEPDGAAAAAEHDDEPVVSAEAGDRDAPSGGSAQVPPAFCPAPSGQSASPVPPEASACVDSAESCWAPAAFVIGGGVLPAPLLAPLLDRATLRPIRHPGDAPPEPHYRPSQALADFVRCRDLTCRWPGCDKPAYGCDIDHTVPWPIGPTHASNIKCYCRFHHLLKTFYCGVGGWREQQRPDATLILTAPTGHTYTTTPGSAAQFPTLCQPSATLWPPGHEPTVPTSDGRGAMMPTRRRTRADNRARRIQAERKLNDDYLAERNKPPPF